MENSESVQYVDPEVTKIKFNQEIREFKRLENEYRKKGVICFKITPLSINLLFAIPSIMPQPIAFAVKIDYTNWDVEPPSIRFIDPFTEHILQREEIKINFYQVKDKNAIRILPNGHLAELDLLQGANGIVPFFCIQGVREYHNHPAHSGNSWMLYRKKEEGKLCVLIDQLYSHSIAQTGGYTIQVEVKANVTGFSPDIKKLQS